MIDGYIKGGPRGGPPFIKEYDLLTRRQASIMDWIVMYVQEADVPPSVREIGRRFDIRSTNGVSDHLRALERKGWVSNKEGNHRSVRLTDRTKVIYRISSLAEDERRMFLKLGDLVDNFPSNVDMSECVKPLDGARLVHHMVRDILDEFKNGETNE